MKLPLYMLDKMPYGGARIASNLTELLCNLLFAFMHCSEGTNILKISSGNTPNIKQKETEMQKLNELYVRLMTEVNLALESAMKPREGQGMVEYALIIVLVSIAAIVALGLLGGQIKNVFQTITNTLSGSGS